MLGGDEILGLYEPQVSLHINMPREVAWKLATNSDIKFQSLAVDLWQICHTSKSDHRPEWLEIGFYQVCSLSERPARGWVSSCVLTRGTRLAG